MESKKNRATKNNNSWVREAIEDTHKALNTLGSEKVIAKFMQECLAKLAGKYEDWEELNVVIEEFNNKKLSEVNHEYASQILKNLLANFTDTHEATVDEKEGISFNQTVSPNAVGYLSKTAFHSSTYLVQMPTEEPKVPLKWRDEKAAMVKNTGLFTIGIGEDVVELVQNGKAPEEFLTFWQQRRKSSWIDIIDTSMYREQNFFEYSPGKYSEIISLLSPSCVEFFKKWLAHPNMGIVPTDENPYTSRLVGIFNEERHEMTLVLLGVNCQLGEFKILQLKIYSSGSHYSDEYVARLNDAIPVFKGSYQDAEEHLRSHGATFEVDFDEEQAIWINRWLNECCHRSLLIERNCTTCTWKHHVERWIEEAYNKHVYISNDTMKIVLTAKGFLMARGGDSTENWVTNIMTI